MKINKYLSPLVILALYSAVVCDPTTNSNSIDVPNDINKIDASNNSPSDTINKESGDQNNGCKCSGKKDSNSSSSEKPCLSCNGKNTEKDATSGTGDNPINILSPNYTDDFFNSVIANINTIDNGDYKTKYEDFKSKYDNIMAIDQKEFEIFSKLVEGFMKNNKEMDLSSDYLYEVITKALSDKAFKAEFKDFMNNMYSFVKKKHEGKTLTESDKQYMTLFENVLSLLNSM
ncbi:MSP7-like protein [Plasmodium vinckei brucechwatti]|uniref:MSP7-like protein n=1 Tax=Plasmodium vinckei brucechwatti TaxID=119398 RepID=A0A6V7SSR7_PLAVN|nr:MSP7-like protein [Plasmodium vinckei brucechwatti]